MNFGMEDVDRFEWVVGRTMLSSPMVMPVTWVVYLGGIWLLHRAMKTREAWSLKSISAIHNMILCIWSAIMFIGVVVGLLQRVQEGGMERLYCDSEAPSGPVYFWMYIYFLSKFVELFDTVIIILKKKPLIFLHVYHHAIVVLMVWLWMTGSLVFSGIGMAFNTFVHVFMYYYYFASIMGWQVWWKRYITTVQIIQFVSSFLLSIPYVYYAVGFSSTGQFEPRCSGFSAFLFSFGCNLSFLILFVQFYQRAYSRKTE